MNIKALTIGAILSVSVSSGLLYAGASHQITPATPDMKQAAPPVQTMPAKPDTWHSHPANPFTNDIHHSHPNGQNEHVHNYGTGSGSSDKGVEHIHAGYRYVVCPYPGH